MMKYSEMEIRNPIFVNFKHEIYFPSFEALFLKFEPLSTICIKKLVSKGVPDERCPGRQAKDR